MTVDELLAANPFDGCVEISVLQTLAVLVAAPIRVEVQPAGWFGGLWTQPLILHDGKWKHLCRTDLCDDIATGSCQIKTAEQWRAHYLDLLGQRAYGGRYNDARFSIIDCFSDG